MNCFNSPNLAPHERRLKSILGPIKPIAENELPIFGQAILGIECQEQEQLQELVHREYISHLGENAEPLFVATPAAIHGPRAQTVGMWKAMMDLGFRWRRLKKRKFIYLQPLNTFPDFIMDFETNAYDGFFELLLSFSQAFFSGLEVKILPSLDIEEAGWNVTSRFHSKTKQKQFLVGDIQRCLMKNLPKDGFCSLGISWTDLYPSEDLNFVLGEANAGTFSGAFCFGRFEPKAYQGDIPPPPIEKVDGKLLWKMLKVLTHETCHIFGLAHCIYFQCTMNESTSVEQAMNQPLFLCPVCLRKLQRACGFTLRQRYLRLLHELTQVNAAFPYEKFDESIAWLNRCLSFLPD